MSNFIVKSSNPNSKNGFVTKVQCRYAVDNIFGSTKSETYYVSGTKQVPIDTEIDEATIKSFKVREFPMINPETGEEFMGKWLTLN